jgi:hypothetical protein
MRRGTAIPAAVGISVAGLLAACAGTTSTPTPTIAPTFSAASPQASDGVEPTAMPTASKVALYLVDRNLNDSLGQQLPVGILAGVKGAMAGGEAPAEFQQRLLEQDPGLTTLFYAAEAYDGVILAALTAASAKSDAGADLAGQLAPLTNGTEPCFDYATCLALVEKGESIAYQGVSGASAFTSAGEPTAAQVGIYEFGADNRLKPEATYKRGQVQVADAVEQRVAAAQAGAGDGVFTVGIVPQPEGALSLLNPAQRAAVELAVADITAAGGIPGFERVVLVDPDSAAASPSASPAKAKAAPASPYKRLVAQRPDVVIGPPSAADMVEAVRELGKAGVLVVSPTSTAAAPAAGGPLVWRMSPTNLLQGAMLGTVVLDDGHRKVAILSSGDAYGEQLADGVAAAVQQRGGTVVARITYDPASPDFAGVVGKAKAADPDSIVLTGGPESASVIQEIVSQGIGPNTIG